jgi:hypothetical protein
MLYAGSLWLSNSAYLYLSVSFIQMTKSLMPGLVYACGCLVGTETPRLSAALNMALIAVGVVVCALGEVNLVVAGLLQQLVALGFEVSNTGCASNLHLEASTAQQHALTYSPRLMPLNVFLSRLYQCHTNGVFSSCV